MIRALSHMVIATADVAKMQAFFQKVFRIEPYFANSAFCEFVLPSKARIAFFLPTGKTKKYFNTDATREAVSFGVTVDDVDETYKAAVELGYNVSGEPKDHPWGERSFLLVDPDQNRWEVTRSPSKDGHLVNLE